MWLLAAAVRQQVGLQSSDSGIGQVNGVVCSPLPWRTMSCRLERLRSARVSSSPSPKRRPPAPEQVEGGLIQQRISFLYGGSGLVHALFQVGTQAVLLFIGETGQGVRLSEAG